MEAGKIRDFLEQGGRKIERKREKKKGRKNEKPLPLPFLRLSRVAEQQ